MPNGFRYSIHEFGLQTLAIWRPEDFSGSASPLILFSHGYRGCGTQSSYILEHLASRGYIVAAPDHADSRLCSIRQRKRAPQKLDFRKSMLENGSSRISDLRESLDELLRMNRDPQSDFHRSIDEDRIGIAGHSYGGWTALALAGAEPQAHDSRLKAALMFAPFLKDFSNRDYARIKIPVMHILGERDQYTLHPLTGFLLHEPRIQRRTAYDNGNAPKYLLTVKNASHFTFANYTCFFYNGNEDCREHNPKARAIAKFSLLFFDAHLKQDSRAGKSLVESDPFLLQHEWNLPIQTRGDQTFIDR